MIGQLNEFSAVWAGYFMYFTAHNTVFLAIILTLLYVFRNKSAAFLRALALIGLAKLVIPPFIDIPLHSEQASGIFAMPLSAVGFEAVPGGASESGHSLSLQAFGFTFWAVILLALIAYAAYRLIILKRFSGSARLVEVKNAGVRTGNKQVRFYQSDYEHSPFVTGLFRHRIILPKSWTSWPDDHRNAVIAHELAHIRQYDYIVNIMQVLAQAVNFFNPLAWILNKKLSQYSEWSCDDHAVRNRGVDRVKYTQLLVGTAERIILPVNAYSVLPSFSDSHNNLKQRVRYQLDRAGRTGRAFTMKNIAILCAAALLLFAFSWYCSNEPSNIVSPDIQEKTASAQEQVSDVEQQMTPEFLPFEDQPKIIGGMAALQKKVQYPEIAKRAGIEGLVLIQTLVDTDGRPVEFKVTKSLGNNGCDEAAIEAIRLIKFIPAKLNGQAVPFRINIPIRFQLKK